MLALQIAVCVPAMGGRTLWLDEAFSAITARKTFFQIWVGLAHDAGPPLYYDLLHLWHNVWGDSAFALRSLSLVFALGTTVLLYRLATVLFDRRTACISTLLWVVHPLTVFYAGEARNYTQFAFVALVLVSVLISIKKSTLSFLALGATLVALTYTHNIAWFCAAAALLAMLLVYRPQVLDKKLVPTLVATALSYLPWVPILRRQLANSHKTIWWMRDLWTPWSPLQSLETFAPFGRKTFLMNLPAVSEQWWPVVAAYWLIPAAALLVPRPQPVTRTVRFLWLYLCLGLVLPVAWSAMREPIVMPGRTDFFLLPVFVLLVGAGLARAKTWFRVVSLLVLTVSATLALIGHHQQAAGFDEREWVDFLRNRARPGDVVICTGLTRAPAEYYLWHTGLVLLSFPRDMTEELAHFNSAWYEHNLDAALDAAAVVSEALSKLDRGHRLWVTVSHANLERVLQAEIARRPTLVKDPFVVSSSRMGMQRINVPVQVDSYLDSSQATPNENSSPNGSGHQ